MLRLIVGGAEIARLAVIPGGVERRQRPRISGPRIVPDDWHSAEQQRVMDAQYGLGGTEPPTAA